MNLDVEDFMRTLHDFLRMLLSVTVQDVESIVQDVEIKGNRVKLTEFSYYRCFNRNTHLQ